jgi:hypothetical protein
VLAVQVKYCFVCHLLLIAKRMIL